MTDQSIHVLLIEDNPGDVRLIMEMLAAATSAHFTLENHARLADGIERLQHGEIAVVLLDLSLPDSHGLDTLNRLLPQAESVPVVVLTGDNDRDAGVRAMQQGAQDYLSKDEVTTQLLERAIRYAIERHRLKATLQALALTDELTELSNRRGFLTLARQQIKVAQRQGRSLLLLSIDMDGLKQINDSYGHEAGDNALIQTAVILRQTFRDADVIGRLGGDEFSILMLDADQESAPRLVARLQQNLAAHNAQTKDPYNLSITVGLAVFDPATDSSLPELMSQADQALYADKRRGEARPQGADPEERGQ